MRLFEKNKKYKISLIVETKPKTRPPKQNNCLKRKMRNGTIVKCVNLPSSMRASTSPQRGSTPKYTGTYVIISGLDNDRYVVGDVPGHQLSQKPYQGVLLLRE